MHKQGAPAVLGGLEQLPGGMVTTAEDQNQNVGAKTGGTPGDMNLGETCRDPAPHVVQIMEHSEGQHSDTTPGRPNISRMAHQKEEDLTVEESSAQQGQGTDTVKQIDGGPAGERGNMAFRSNRGKQNDLEQRLLMYARRLQETSVEPADRERPNEVHSLDDPFSIQMPLNRSTSRMPLPVAVEVLAEVEKDASNVATNLVQLMATLRASLADVSQFKTNLKNMLSSLTLELIKRGPRMLWLVHALASVKSPTDTF